MFCYEYPRPAVTVDIVVFTIGIQEVLLIQRKQPPFENHWALPGGFVEIAESLETAARRELEEETGITDITLTEIGTFGGPNRDPRGRVITIAYATVVEKSKVNIKAGSDASKVTWAPTAIFNNDTCESKLAPQITELAFDHNEIIRKAITTLK